MKTLAKDELYHHLSGFLRTKGIELKDGSYARGIQKSCQLLAEAINAGQNGLACAKTQVDRKLDRMRQVIHEKTAPKPPPTPKSSEPTAAGTTSTASGAKGAKKASTAKPKSAGKPRRKT